MTQAESRSSLRVGVIIPSSNTTIEPDFARSVAPGSGVGVHSARMFLTETTAAAERVMVEQYLPRAVTDLASLHPAVVAFACTSAGAVLGAQGEADLIERIATETGGQVVSTNSAVQTAIARYAPERIAVLTPYIDELNERIQLGLEGSGFEVAHLAGLGLTENFSIASVTPAQILAFAERQLVGVEFDLLFVSCTNFRAMEARQALAARFGVPVVTSNQATIEASLEALGLESAEREAARV